MDSTHLNRRTLLLGAAGASITPLAVSGVAFGQTAAESTPEASGTAADPGSTCLLSPELTEGPYYRDDQFIPQDITEGKGGLPLELRMTVIDATTCAPLENAAVEIWHCDANGFYSGFVEANPDGQGANAG